MKTVDVIAGILLIVGGLNWGFWGLFQFDLVAALFGGNASVISRIIYTLVGVAAVYQALSWKTSQQRLGTVRA